MIRGELPLGWTHTTLEKLLSSERPLCYGVIQPGDDVTEGNTLIRVCDLVDGSVDIERLRRIAHDVDQQYQRSRVEKGDVLVSIVGTIGRVSVVPGELSGSNIARALAKLSPNCAVTSAWLAYWLSDPEMQDWLVRESREVARKTLNLGELAQAPVRLAPLPEQRRIIEKIEALMTRSRRAREALDTLPAQIDRYRQSILAAAFRGDLTADWRGRSAYTPIAETLTTIALPSQSRGGREATDAIIPGVGGIAVNDPGTPLPDGWAWVALRRVARQETGHTPSRSVAEYWDGEFAWLGIKDANIHHGKVISDTVQHITQEGLDNSSARLLPSGTVCLSRTASVGYVTIMGKDMATSQDFATWTCGDALDPHYLMYALMSEGDNIRRFGEGSTHTTIYFPEIRAFHIALAPVEEQREVVRRIKAAMGTVDVLEGQLRAATSRLATLDQSVLAKAFRGELVPQDPNDEPASVLLERIRAERAAAGPVPRRGRRPKAAGGG